MNANELLNAEYAVGCPPLDYSLCQSLLFFPLKNLARLLGCGCGLQTCMASGSEARSGLDKAIKRDMKCRLVLKIC